MSLLAIPSTVASYSVEIDRQDFKTRIEGFKPAPLKAKMDTIFCGGFAGEIEIPCGGVDPLVFALNFVEHLGDLYAVFLKTLVNEQINLTMRGVEFVGNQKKNYVIKATGFLKSLDPSEITRGTKQTMASEFTAYTYQVIKANQEVLMIDVPGNIIKAYGRVINADENAILGIT